MQIVLREDIGLSNTLAKVGDAPNYLSKSGWSASATNTQAGYPASNTLDADTNVVWWSGTGIPQSLIYDFGSPLTFNGAGIATDSGQGSDVAKSFSVYVSDNGSDWELVASGKGISNNGATIWAAFTSVTKRYLKITVTETFGGGWCKVGEIYLIDNAEQAALLGYLIDHTDLGLKGTSLTAFIGSGSGSGSASTDLPEPLIVGA